jgi:ParB family chromosome partitioning protein
VKANKRRVSTQNNNASAEVEIFPPQGEQGKTRDIVASKSGFGSGKNFEKAKYISDNADDEMIKSLDEGGIETWKQYQSQKLKGYQTVL